MKCRATVKATFEIEFEDEGDLVLIDQAMEEAIFVSPVGADLEIVGEIKEITE